MSNILLMLVLSLVLNILIIFATSDNIHSEIADNVQLWIENNSTFAEERRSRAINGFNQENSVKNNQCPGTVITMLEGFATVLKSHNGYGKVPYPSDYLCRWLILPKDCELSLVCNLSTRERRRARGERRKCSIKSDYLRVEGYAGALDTYYCGQNENISIKLHENNPVKLTFKGQERESSFDRDNRDRILNIFEGFRCELQCKKPKNGAITTTARPSLTSTSIDKNKSTTTTSKPSKPGLLRDSCQCGQLPYNVTREGRIVCPKGAKNCGAEVGEIPWQAGLVFKGKHQPWCGGTLISDRYVLTAAHCVKNRSVPPFEYQVILGDNNWRTRKEVQEWRYDILEIKVHPRFEERAPFDFDFALIKLSNQVDFANQYLIRPACLPSLLDDDNLEGLIGTASGWGVVNPDKPSQQANQLQKVNVKIINDRHCQYKYPTYPAIVTSSMFCARANSADSCYGDSGGPFTVVKNNISILEGVISWGKSCAKSKWPGVYARVRMVLDWVKENIRNSNRCERKESVDSNISISTSSTNDKKETTTKIPVIQTTSTQTSTSSAMPTSVSSSEASGNDNGCICGIVQNTPRIVCPHGVRNCKADIGSVPWQVGLVSKRKYRPWCGGTLINDRYILTAAHCVKTLKPNMFEVVLGDVDWTTRKETFEIRRSVSKIHIHPRFGEKATFDHDYAILKLQIPIDFYRSSFIRPVCLPLFNQNDNLEKKTGTVSGWGVVDPKVPTNQANILQKVDVKIVSNRECRNRYPVKSVTETMFCARANGSDSCYGDSGGPLTVFQNGSHILEGVISWGKNCAKPQWPGVYSRVGHVLEWIRDTTVDSISCWKKRIESHLPFKNNFSNVDLLLNGK